MQLSFIKYHLQRERTISLRLESEKVSSLSNVVIGRPPLSLGLTFAKLSVTLSRGPNTQLS